MNFIEFIQDILCNVELSNEKRIMLSDLVVNTFNQYIILQFNWLKISFYQKKILKNLK